MTIQQILHAHGKGLLDGLGITLKLALIVWASGIVIGPLLGAAGSKWRWGIGLPSKMVSVTLAGMPALVFLFWMHYPMQALFSVVIDPFLTAALTLSIINVFMVADLCRGAINDFPTQYLWAARVCGLSGKETALHIKLPILLRQVLPGLLIIQITMLQATLFASFISVNEIFRAAQRVNSLVFKPVEIYTMLALAFIAVCVPLHLFAHYLRNRFTRDVSER